MATYIALTKIEDDGTKRKALINMDQILFCQADKNGTKLFRNPAKPDFRVEENLKDIIRKLSEQ